MFFAKPGEYEACKVFSMQHFILLLITLIVIGILLFLTKKSNREKVLKIIKGSTIFLWFLEIIKIVFNLLVGNGSNINTYIPLYYCSLMLYAGIFSGFCKGKLRKIGDVFLATGGIVAGMGFLISPITSLSTYPVFHFISIQSFILHGTMLYLGILVNITNYIELKLEDFKYYFILIIVISLIAYIINMIFGSNLMFISKNYPGTIIEPIYNLTGKLFTPIAVILQATIPFYVMYYIVKFIKKSIKIDEKAEMC